MTRWLVGAVLLLIVVCVASVDHCLIAGSPESPFTSYSTVGLGLSIQGVSLAGLIVAFIGGGARLRSLTGHLTRPMSKVLSLVGAVILLWFSTDIIAYGVYNAGVNNKLESSRRVDSAMSACCRPLQLLQRL